MSKKDKRLVPKLRFPGFVEKWNKMKFIEFAILQRGYDINASQAIKGEIPVYSSSGISYYHNHSKVTSPGVITGRKGKLGNVFFVEKPFWPHGTTLYVKDFKGNHPKFVYWFLTILKLERLDASTSNPTLNRNNVHALKISIPTLPEQQKIATFLTAVDKKIRQLTRKKALLEQYKKGVMQQLFSQQIRFKDEQGEAFPAWEEKGLGEIGAYYNGLTGKTKEDFGKGKPYITYKQIFDNSKIEISKVDYVEIKKGDKQNTAKYGDIFFTTSSETPKEVGFSSVLLDEAKELYLNSFCFGFRPNSFKILNPTFARFLFRSEGVRKEIIKLAQGSTRYNMSKIQLMKLKVNLPKEKEQQQIAKFLISLDTKINQAGDQVEKMETWKRGLLQQLFA